MRRGWRLWPGKKRVAVIISDAMRYEIGEALSHRIQSEGRYQTKIEPMLSMLPSVTALGMAALLPQSELSLDVKGNVLANGQSTMGTPARDALLQAGAAFASQAVPADTLMALGRQGCRDLVKDSQILYVYHNVIDAIGDDRVSEERAFEAVDTAMDDLVNLVKRLDGANVSSVLITADHGFLFQQQPVDEGDYTDVTLNGSPEDYRRARRYILGGSASQPEALMSCSAAQLGLGGDLRVHFARSINRLRLQGAGSRYVHGGTSLQEVLVPVVSVTVQRERDVAPVDVEVLLGSSQTITTGQITIKLYQSESVSDKRLARTLRIGLYANDGQTAISNLHTVVFDRASEVGRDRESSYQFVLNDKANDHNGQQVSLLLEERIGGTDQFRRYKKVSYTLRIGIAPDF